MRAIIRYTLITAMRDWLFLGLFVLSALAIALSMFLGSTALVEQQEMAMAYSSGSTRLAIIIGLITFICFHVRRSFENREIEVILSRPISRPAFVFSYWCGFAILGLVVTLPLIAAVWILFPVNMLGLLYWGSSLICETALVVAFTLLSALILRSAVTAVLSSLGFYIMARMMGFFTAAITKPAILEATQGFDFNNIMEFLLRLISIAFPRLDLFGKSAWLVYGVTHPTDLWVFPLQSLIYIPLLLLVAIVDFRRKQF